MKKIKESKYFIGVIVLSTIVLAAVATFTAYKLYELRDVPVAPNVPEGNVYAFSCEEYQLLIDTNGTVRISNVSGEAQPTQEIDIIVGGQSLGSFTIPALDPQTNAEIGGINLPSGDFNWNIDGDILCAGNQSGTLHESESCNEFKISIASAQTLPTLTPTIIPTSTPILNTPTPTITNTVPTKTPTPTTSQNSTNTVATNTPTPTTQQISNVSELPDTGIGSITTIILVFSTFSLLAAFLVLAK